MPDVAERQRVPVGSNRVRVPAKAVVVVLPEAGIHEQRGPARAAETAVGEVVARLGGHAQREEVAPSLPHAPALGVGQPVGVADEPVRHVVTQLVEHDHRLVAAHAIERRAVEHVHPHQRAVAVGGSAHARVVDLGYVVGVRDEDVIAVAAAAEVVVLRVSRRLVEACRVPPVVRPVHGEEHRHDPVLHVVRRRGRGAVVVAPRELPCRTHDRRRNGDAVVTRGENGGRTQPVVADQAVDGDGALGDGRRLEPVGGPVGMRGTGCRAVHGPQQPVARVVHEVGETGVDREAVAEQHVVGLVDVDDVAEGGQLAEPQLDVAALPEQPVPEGEQHGLGAGRARHRGSRCGRRVRRPHGPVVAAVVEPVSCELGGIRGRAGEIGSGARDGDQRGDLRIARFAERPSM